MGQLKKDVELVFKGTDRATPTIKGVRSEVASLTSAIEQQLAAAERGEGSIDDLARSYKALQAAQGDVGEITRLATAYEALTQKHAEQAVKAAEAAAKEAALTGQIEAAEAPTKRLQNERAAAARAAAAAAAKEAELAAEVRRAGDAFEAAGGDTKRFEASQDAIRAAALETARALRDGAAALDLYKDAQASGAAGRAAQDEASRFGAMAATSGLPQEQIAFISGLENRIEMLTAAMRENEASAAAMNREIANKAAMDAQQRIRAMAAAMDEAENAARRLEAATAFKSQAASIEANAREIERFGAQADTASVSSTRFADTIQAIIAPTSAAARTLDGVNEVIARSESILDGTKRRLSEYHEEMNSLNTAMAGISDMARSIDAFRAQEAAVASAKQEFEAIQAKVIAAAQAIKAADEPTEAMSRDLVKLEASLEKAGTTLQRESTRLKTLEASLESANIDVRALASAEDELTAAAKRAAEAQAALEEKTGGKGNFLGLNPMELQNIGYQINDIMVSLASGQNPFTVLMQQGAQIGQIIPGAFTAILRFLPQIAVLAAVLFTVGGAIQEVADQAERLKMGGSIVAQLGGDTTNVTAQQFAALAKELEGVEVEAADARAALVSLGADGLDAGQMQQYIETAKDVAKVTGVDMTQALEDVRSHFQGGMSDIEELDSATGFLDETTRSHIETLFEQGRADEARAEALRAYAQKMDEVASASDGPWKRAIDNLSSSWSNFLSWLGNTRPFQAVISYMNDVAVGANYIAARLNGKSHEEAGREAVGQVPRSTQTQPGDPNRRTNAGRAAIREAEEELAATKASTAEQKRAVAGRKAMNKAIADGATNREAERVAALAMQSFDIEEGRRQDKKDAAAGKRAAAAERRREAQARAAARRAAAEARAIASAEEQLQRQLETLDAAVANKQEDNLEHRLSAIDSQYERLFRSIDAYAAKTGGRGMIGDKTIEQARAHVKLQQDALKNYETMEFRERQLQNLLSEREDRLERIDDQVARGLMSPAEGLEQSRGVIDETAVKIAAMATSAITFAEALRGAVPSPQLDAFIAKMQTALQNNSGGQNVRAMQTRTIQAIETAEQGLNSIIERRNALVQHENALVELGLQTRAQAMKNVEGHYNNTATLIRDHIQKIRTLAAAYGTEVTPEMELYFKTLEARLEAADVEATHVDMRFNQLKTSIDQLLTSNIIGFIDAVAQSFAKLATGKGDVLDFFASIGLAFLDMIAKTLQGIAMLILQMIILDTVEKFTGIPVKALLQLYGGAGVFHDGGVAGQSGGRSRNLSPLIFANAPRYHGGGVAGLAPDEVAAVLRKNEEVLTEDDPRHRFNGGLSGGSGEGPRAIRNMLLIGDDEIAGAMAGAAGEDVVMTHLRSNRAAVKQMLRE